MSLVSRTRSKNKNRQSFTVIELLVATVILLLIVTLLLSMVNQTASIWTSTLGKSQQYERSRAAFEIITSRLSRATLNTYWDYSRDANGNPTEYIRQSELRFLSGQTLSLVAPVTVATSTTTSTAPNSNPGHAIFFQAPGGVSLANVDGTLPGSLNTWGYYVQYGSDQNFRPPFLNGIIPVHYRYRLFEVMEPSDQLTIYNYTSGTNTSGPNVGKPKNLTYTGEDWFQNAIKQGNVETRILADNVIALVILPKVSPDQDPTGTNLAPLYSYDSTLATNAGVSPAVAAAGAGLYDPKNQLPPLVQVIMVVVEENSHVTWGSTAPNLGIQSQNLFQNAGNAQADVNTLETNLRTLGLHPHHFSLTVPLVASKWSTSQTN
jgi:uncharacterized protein (TIGR02599 family)